MRSLGAADEGEVWWCPFGFILYNRESIEADSKERIEWNGYAYLSLTTTPFSGRV